MKSLGAFFGTNTGQLVLVGILAVVAAIAVFLRHGNSPTPQAMPNVKVAEPSPLPRTIVREGAPLPKEAPVLVAANPVVPPITTKVASKVQETPLPLSLLEPTPAKPVILRAPFGRLIPCETVLTLESNRLETPVIGLVTESVWHEGELVIPVGAEVHGRASPDRARERLAAEGTWTIVWRTPGQDNGTELRVQGLALDRERDPVTGQWGLHDGSAGLRGEVLRSNDWHAVQLFAATFLSSATLALQQTRTTTGALGESVTPAATARNAALAGSSAVLREYANQIRESIERDGLYVRVPAGKPFYLYVTQTIERGGSASGSDHAR